MEQKSYYLRRLLARLMDLLLIGLIAQIEQAINPLHANNLLVWYLLYNVVVILFNGKTLGKYSLSLSIKIHDKGMKRVLILIIREFLVILLSPLLLINLLFIAPIPLHDRIIGTRVARNER